MKQRYYCRARDADSKGLFVEGFRMNHRSVRSDGDSETCVYIRKSALFEENEGDL